MIEAEEAWIGQDAPSVMARLVTANPEIAQVTFVEVPGARRFEAPSEPSAVELAVIQEGIELRETIGIPFWEAVLLACERAPEAPLRIVESASYHVSLAAKARRVSSQDVSSEQMEKMATELPSSSILAIASVVELKDGSRRHLPMLDFRCSYTSTNMEIVAAIATSLDVNGGVLLHSGESFHFYGERLLTDEELVEFLGRALLFTPLVDHRWVGHQLIEGACALRISADASGYVPMCVMRIHVNSDN